MEVSGSLHAPASLPPVKESQVRIVQEAEWAVETAWKLWNRELSLAPTGNKTPAVQPVARRYTD
jgi:hypothetical protein